MGIAERIEREKAARIKLIINAAAAVFNEKGFEAATIEDIISRAEVSKSMLYQYFKSKDDLYYSVIQPALARLEKNIEKIADNAREAPEMKIKKMSVALFQFYRKEPDAYHLVTRYKAKEFARLLSEDKLQHLQNLMRSGRVQCAKVVEEGIQQGKFRKIDPYTASVIFWSAFMGVVHFQEQRMGPGKKDYTLSTIDTYMDWLLKGIAGVEAFPSTQS